LVVYGQGIRQLGSGHALQFRLSSRFDDIPCTLRRRRSVMGIDPRFSHLRVTPRYLIRTYLLTVGTAHIPPPLPLAPSYLGPAGDLRNSVVHRYTQWCDSCNGRPNDYSMITTTYSPVI
jgi:hypothetical protein